MLENRRMFDYRQNPPPQLPNILFAYRVDPNSRRVQGSGVGLTGNVIKRNVALGDTWGPAAGVDLVGSGEGLANTLNYAGEHWWDFRNIQVTPENRIRLDAVYQAQDLVESYQWALWTNGPNETIPPNASLGEEGHVVMVGRSIPVSQGRRYHREPRSPNWDPNGWISGTYRVQVPARGARLYVTAALSEAAVGSDGVTVSVAVNGILCAQGALTLQRNVRTVVVDLLAEANTLASISIIIGAGPTATRDWAYILEAIIVPTAPVLIDLWSLRSTAIWSNNSGVIPFGGDIGPQGHARVKWQRVCRSKTA